MQQQIIALLINTSMKISDIITETTAGAVATVAVPLGGMRKRPNPSVFYKAKKKKIKEGEERSIIQHACVEKLVDEFAGEEGQFDNRDDFEYAIYQELERLNVEDCVDPRMEVGGQPIGDFASGRVLDVISASDVIYDVMQNMDLSQLPEGKSPHKKGTKKYKKHMAAMHAG
tara:strand:- start:4183 stop:4698 length:516 start_codon:yes stop_codon:yes gene_type:complete